MARYGSYPLKAKYCHEMALRILLACIEPLGRTVSKNTSVRYLPGFGPVVPQECSDCVKVEKLKEKVNTAAEVIYDLVDPSANIIFGAVIDPSISGQVSKRLI
ncbi:hypothetical protein L1987_32856 [Smallanthus sonchifolius]|uniref:Uncharacterized protein n=1 Tax=Smallanthus sonchifolius TaxID=185202 RepID=A0ACB9HQM1_9ASTR|nr:hypothetical protein L1987_32856 [Smallanthus sonchifolius]